MGRNLDSLKETGKFVLPVFDEEHEEFFEKRVEWRLERLRRTDFDITGEHANYAQCAPE